MRKLFLSSLAVNVLVRFINLWTGVLSARFLGPFGRGELAAATRWSSLFVLLFTVGLPGAVIFYGKQSRERQGEYVAAYFVIGTFMGLIGLVVGELMIPYLFSKQPTSLIRLAQISMLSVPLGVIADGFIGTLQTVNLFSKILRIRVLGEIGTLLVIISLIFIGKYTVGYFIIINMLWSMLVLIYTTFLTVRTAKLEFTGLFRNIRALLLKGLHIYSASIVGMFGANIDQLVISLFLIPSVLGFYAVASSVAGILPAVLSGALSVYLWPKLMDIDQDGRLRKVENIHGVLFFTSLILSCFAGALLPILLPIVYGRDFSSSMLMAEIILATAPIQIGTSVLSYLLSTANRFTSLTFKELFGLACGLAVTMPLLHVWEGVGAAIGLSVANLSKWVYLIFATRNLGLSFRRAMYIYPQSFVSLYKTFREMIWRRSVVTGDEHVL